MPQLNGKKYAYNKEGMRNFKQDKQKKENKSMTKTELDKYKKEKGKFHESDPRHPMNAERTKSNPAVKMKKAGGRKYLKKKGG
jgi:hypothetical protein